MTLPSIAQNGNFLGIFSNIFVIAYVLEYRNVNQFHVKVEVLKLVFSLLCLNCVLI